MANDDSGISYGPAQERVTKTPISFEDFPPGQYGGYSATTPLEDFPSLFQSGDLSNGIKAGILRIAKGDPNQSNTIKHEAIHQVLMKQFAGQYGLGAVHQATAADPDLTSAVSKIGSGNMADEVPAYVLSGDPRLQTPALHNIIQTYSKKTIANLQKLNPQLANQVLQLSPQGQSSQ